MSVAVILASAGLACVAVGAVAGYVAGRRSAREELAAAEAVWVAQNNAPVRDALALPPERPDTIPGPYDWDVTTTRSLPAGRTYHTRLS